METGPQLYSDGVTRRMVWRTHGPVTVADVRTVLGREGFPESAQIVVDPQSFTEKTIVVTWVEPGPWFGSARTVGGGS